MFRRLTESQSWNYLAPSGNRFETRRQWRLDQLLADDVSCVMTRMVKIGRFKQSRRRSHDNTVVPSLRRLDHGTRPPPIRSIPIAWDIYLTRLNDSVWDARGITNTIQQSQLLPNPSNCGCFQSVNPRPPVHCEGWHVSPENTAREPCALRHFVPVSTPQWTSVGMTSPLVSPAAVSQSRYSRAL